MYLNRMLLHPEIYQGKYKKENYFEGWYYKLVDRTRNNAIAVIPGVSFEKENRHAFIQLFQSDNHVNYIKYNISEFDFSDRKFEIRIGDNFFSRDKLNLNISNDLIHVQGKLNFDQLMPYPNSIFWPGIMGPFSYIPFLECYHGVVNIKHRINGSLNISGDPIDFTDGIGYIEKDWGKSFPKTWIWLQSNHFSNDDISLMLSVGKIPFLHGSFQGFLCYIRIENKFYLFTTYNGAKIIKKYDDKKSLRLMVKKNNLILEMETFFNQGGTLKAPDNGVMRRDIVESMSATVRVKLIDVKKNLIVFRGQGTNTGLEICR